MTEMTAAPRPGKPSLSAQTTPPAADAAQPSAEVAQREAPDPRSVWVLIPVYNEGAVIAGVVREARKSFPNVLCIDDGSSDDSAARAASAGAVVVRHPINLGQGAALQTGFEYALSVPGLRYVVTFDADGQHQMADALDMLRRIGQGDVKVVFGSRFLDDRTQASLLKKLILRAAVAYTNATTQTRLTDAHNGLRVMDSDVVSRVRITQNRMAHASELVAQIGAMRIDGAKVPYAEMPVHILYTDYSKSKGQSLWNSVNILADLILR